METGEGNTSFEVRHLPRRVSGLVRYLPPSWVCRMPPPHSRTVSPEAIRPEISVSFATDLKKMLALSYSWNRGANDELSSLDSGFPVAGDAGGGVRRCRH